MGRPFASHRQFTAFGEYVLTLAQAKGIKFDLLTKAITRTRLYETVREPIRRKRAPPRLTIGELCDLAAALKANDQETARIILLGLLQQAPPELASCTIAAITHTMAQAVRLNAPQPPELDLSGDHLTLPDKLPRFRRPHQGQRSSR
jgi:hypothetical protein